MAHADSGFSGRMPNPARFRRPPPSTSMMVPPASDLMNARILLPGAPYGGGHAPLAASSMALKMSTFDKNNFLNDNNTDEKLTDENELPANNQIKIKEKTPMCLIAELVRYNKLTHQYKLVNESGPAHQKQFTVCLILRDGEEYVADGPSIKKAQQAAAKKAVEETKLPRPASNRFPRKRPPFTGKDFGLPNNVPPTVALNDLAIKLNLTLEYSNLSPVHCNPQFIRPPPPQQMFPPFGQPRLLRPRFLFAPPPLHGVCLKIGQFEFCGRGLTRQLARHDAAAKAVKVLQQMQEKIHQTTTTTTSQQNELVQQENCLLVANEMHRLRQIDEFFDESSSELKQTCQTNDESCKDESKSPISMIHELALQRKMDVTFEVVSETGPAHNREFVIRLILRNPGQILITKGDGPCKKRAKHNASEKMIEELKKHDSSTSSNVYPTNRHRPKVSKEKKRKTIIKDVKMDPNYGQQINPISRLVQIQQSKKEDEPVFGLVKEIGQARYKEYVMQVTIGDSTCQGAGPNKKLAKRAAAEAMLDALGFSKPLPKPGKPSLKHQTSFSDDYNGHDDDGGTSSGAVSQNKTDDMNGNEMSNGAGNVGRHRRVTFNLQEASTTSNERSNDAIALVTGKIGRQIAPGLLFLQPGSQILNNCNNEGSTLTTEQSTRINGRCNVDESKNLLEQISSPLVDDAKEQLTYLSSLLKFQMQFTDFPKTLRDGSGGEYLSLISLGVNPSQVFHGSGSTVDLAQNEAAAAALRYLAEKGLDNVAKASTANANRVQKAEEIELEPTKNNSPSNIFPSTTNTFFASSEE